MPPGNKLPVEVIERTRDLAENKGLSARQIAEMMGVARGTVLRRCWDYGITLKGSKRVGGQKGGKATAAKERARAKARAKPKPRHKQKGFVDPNTLTDEEREARAEAAREAEAKRQKSVEKKLKAAAAGALYLPLVTAMAVVPEEGNVRRRRYQPKRYEVTALRDHQCHFAVTDKAPHAFCGKPAAPDSSYCQAHHDICYQDGPLAPLKAPDGRKVS